MDLGFDADNFIPDLREIVQPLRQQNLGQLPALVTPPPLPPGAEEDLEARARHRVAMALHRDAMDRARDAQLHRRHTLPPEEEQGSGDRASARADRQARRYALVQQAASHEDGPRERALRALAETAAIISPRSGGEEHPLYTPADLRATNRSAALLLWTEASGVLTAGASDPLLAARREAIRTFASLTFDPEVAAAVWDNEAARAALLAAAEDGDEDVQCNAHAALSLIPCSGRAGFGGTASSFWTHVEMRRIILSTARRLPGPDGQTARQAPLRVRLEAWDSLDNSFIERSMITSQALLLFELLWFDSNSRPVEDVQAVVLSCLSDDDEDDQVKLKALKFLTRLLEHQKRLQRPHRTTLLHLPNVGGALLARLPDQLCKAVLECADRTAEASAAPVRSAALELCCKMVGGEEDGDAAGDEAARGDLTPRMLSVLLPAVEGEHAVLDRRLRERCDQAYAKLEMASADSAQAAVPLRERRRYAGLGMEERLRRLRQEWERSGEGKPAMRLKVHVGSIGPDMLSVGEGMVVHTRMKTTCAFNATRISFKLDHGTDAGGLTRHCFSEFGKELLQVCVQSSWLCAASCGPSHPAAAFHCYCCSRYVLLR